MANWTSTKRFYVTQDDDLNRIGSQEIADMGELNMSDGETLVDFVAWAVEAYPADRYALILLRPWHGLARRVERSGSECASTVQHPAGRGHG